MFIVPINSTINVKEIAWENQGPGQIQGQEPAEGGQPDSFKDIFQGIVDNVEATQAQKRVDAYNLSIGNMDDMHTMMINAGKAEVAVSTMVELRNKLLDAYSEVMRTNL